MAVPRAVSASQAQYGELIKELSEKVLIQEIMLWKDRYKRKRAENIKMIEKYETRLDEQSQIISMLENEIERLKDDRR